MDITLTLPESIIVRLQRRAAELNVAVDDLAWKLFNDGLMVPKVESDTVSHSAFEMQSANASKGECDNLSALHAKVAEIKARPPNPDMIIPATKTIAEVAAYWDANPLTEDDIPPDEWDTLWANFEARNQFASLVHAVEENSVIEITRRGEPVAVILSIHEYRTLKGEDKDFWTEYLEFYTNNDVKGNGLIEDELTNLRDRTPGREVNLWH